MRQKEGRDQKDIKTLFDPEARFDRLTVRERGMSCAPTGGSVGQVLSSEITVPGCRPCRTMGKATRCAALYSESPTGPAESETLSMRGRSMHEII